MVMRFIEIQRSPFYHHYPPPPATFIVVTIGPKGDLSCTYHQSARDTGIRHDSLASQAEYLRRLLLRGRNKEGFANTAGGGGGKIGKLKKKKPKKNSVG